MAQKRTFEEAKEIVESLNKDLELIEFHGSHQKAKIYCKKCKHFYEQEFNFLKGSQGKCPICTNKVAVKGFNTVKDVRPDLAKLFKNQEEAEQITIGSSKRVTLICPECGAEKTLHMYDFKKYGFKCNVCSDTISYPNKIIRSFLRYYKNKVEEYDWEHSFPWSQNKIYDGYFKKNGQGYVVEMQGEQHYQDAWQTLSEQENNDELKEKLAADNGLIYIAINCKKLDSNLIKQYMNDSVLFELFKMTEEDWRVILEESEKNITKEICNYNNNVTHIFKDICQEFHINKTTLRRYVKRGVEIGWVKDYYGENGKAVRSFHKPVLIYKENVLLKRCSSINLARDWLEDNCNIKVTNVTVKNHCVSQKPIADYYICFENKSND